MGRYFFSSESECLTNGLVSLFREILKDNTISAKEVGYVRSNYPKMFEGTWRRNDRGWYVYDIDTVSNVLKFNKDRIINIIKGFRDMMSGASESPRRDYGSRGRRRSGVREPWEIRYDKDMPETSMEYVSRKNLEDDDVFYESARWPRRRN